MGSYETEQSVVAAGRSEFPTFPISILRNAPNLPFMRENCRDLERPGGIPVGANGDEKHATDARHKRAVRRPNRGLVRRLRRKDITQLYRRHDPKRRTRSVREPFCGCKRVRVCHRAVVFQSAEPAQHELHPPRACNELRN